MLLAIDIGNTDMVFGIHDGSRWIHQFRHPTSGYSFLEQSLVQEAAQRGFDWAEMDVCILSSVVPGVTPSVERLLGRLLPHRPMLLGPRMYRKLPVKINNPEEIGSDLVANSFAAFDLVKGPCIVVDFGTALTFSTINGKGEIDGVAIAPGLKTAMKSLFMNAAQLPEVPLEWPNSAIGKGTAHALQAGILLGYVGLVRELIAKIKEEMGMPDMAVVATGGLSEVLPPLKKDFSIIDRMLTLDGLRILAQYQSSQSD
ncbi:MAG: type III pantothenate kinase [Bacteroidia bacterium]|nr:type III pantothenate kinase [Bacteroidia bacterium]